MKKIVAIGGGEIGRPGFTVETTAIDKRIIELTSKKHPKLLFIPTASDDSKSYYEVVKKYFGDSLGCKVNVLYLLNTKLSKKAIEKSILNSDIIYVGGGNTLKMMQTWRKLGVDKLLLKAYKKGIVMSGVSAGAVCWFKYANSDSRKFNNPKAELIKVKGLGIINALYCPHYDGEIDRKSGLKKMMKKTYGVAVAVDNCCAIEIIDNKYRIISSKKSANAYKVYWKSGKYYEEKLEKNSNFILIDNLLKK